MLYQFITPQIRSKHNPISSGVATGGMGGSSPHKIAAPPRAPTGDMGKKSPTLNNFEKTRIDCDKLNVSENKIKSSLHFYHQIACPTRERNPVYATE